MKSQSRKANIIVPVYDDWRSIKENIISLKTHYAGDKSVEVYYVNDCGPNVDIIENRIKTLIRGISNFYYVRNEENLGFVKNCNNAVFNIVKNKKSDIILLNSDAKATPGFKEELLRILHSENDICAVSPRGNNATVWSVPTDGSLSHKPKKSYKLWSKLKNHLPEKYISPTIHGFCVAIRRETIDEIGLFDEVYGRGYGEENDFTMKARKAGWKCAIANHAFVFHKGARSFGTKDRESLSSKNEKILLKRYPDYNKLVSQYVADHPEPKVIRSYGILYKLFRTATNAVEYGYVHGYAETIQKIYSTIQKRRIQPLRTTNEPTIQVWSHEITNSGAPLVLLDLLRQWKQSGQMPSNISFNYPNSSREDQSLISSLKDEGINFKPYHMAEVYFNKGDVVILNSTAQPQQLYEKILSGLEDDTIEHLYFYIHEDDETTTGVTREYSNRIKKLIKGNKITIYTPSDQSNNNWKKHFKETNNIHSMPGHVTFHKGMFKKRSAKDFNTINFIIAGSREPRKGIISVLNALATVHKYHIQQNPDKYRDFTLTIVGDDHKNDFHNRFIKNQSSFFGDKIRLLPGMSQTDLYPIIKNSNITITFSVGDSLSMTTFEGMAFGHPIIRSETSGQEEQLAPGKNGWLAQTTNWLELVDSIEEALNKEKTSNEKLSEMSAASINIAKLNHENRFRILDDIQWTKK